MTRTRSIPITTTTTRFTLPVTPPFDWEFFCRYFHGRSTPGVEAIADGRYSRSIRLGRMIGLLHVQFGRGCQYGIRSRSGPRLHVAVHTRGPVDVEATKIRVARMFDLAADVRMIGQSLARGDAAMAACVRSAPWLRVPGAWSAFEVLCRAIVGQQVSVKAATTLMGRISQRLGRPVDFGAGGAGVKFLFPTPRELASGDLDRVGMPGKRVQALQNVARVIADRAIPFADSGDVADLAAAKAALLEQPGIGPWTVEYVALRALRDADAWPATDLVLRRACSSAADSDAWRPWRAYAAMHLWNRAHANAHAPTGG